MDSPNDNPNLFTASGEDGTVQVVDVRSALGKHSFCVVRQSLVRVFLIHHAHIFHKKHLCKELYKKVQSLSTFFKVMDKLDFYNIQFLTILLLEPLAKKS